MINLRAIEGPDGTGKTSFIKRMVDAYKILQLKSPKCANYNPNDPSFRRLDFSNMARFMDFGISLSHTNALVLMDRLTYVTNAAYNRMKNPNYNWEYDIQLTKLFLSNSAFNAQIYILLRDPFTEVYTDDLITLTPDQDACIVRNYEQLAKLLDIPVFRIIDNREEYNKLEDTILWKRE